MIIQPTTPVLRVLLLRMAFLNFPTRAQICQCQRLSLQCPQLSLVHLLLHRLSRSRRLQLCKQRLTTGPSIPVWCPTSRIPARASRAPQPNSRMLPTSVTTPRSMSSPTRLFWTKSLAMTPTCLSPIRLLPMVASNLLSTTFKSWPPPLAQLRHKR